MSDFVINDPAHHVIMVENDGVQVNAIFFFAGDDPAEAWENIGRGGEAGDVYTLYWADNSGLAVEDTFRFRER